MSDQIALAGSPVPGCDDRVRVELVGSSKSADLRGLAHAYRSPVERVTFPIWISDKRNSARLGDGEEQRLIGERLWATVRTGRSAWDSLSGNEIAACVAFVMGGQVVSQSVKPLLPDAL